MLSEFKNEIAKDSKKKRKSNKKKRIEIIVEIICTIIIFIPIIFNEEFEEFLDENIGILLIIVSGFIILLPFVYRLFHGKWPKTDIAKWYTDGK